MLVNIKLFMQNQSHLYEKCFFSQDKINVAVNISLIYQRIDLDILYIMLYKGLLFRTKNNTRL